MSYRFHNLLGEKKKRKDQQQVDKANWHLLQLLRHYCRLVDWDLSCRVATCTKRRGN